MRMRRPEGVAGCLALAIASMLMLGGCGVRDEGVIRPTGDYYDKLAGQWTGSPYAGGVDWERHWAISFGRDHSVFIRTPEGTAYRGMAEMRFDLGADAEGKVRLPPGATLLDVRLDEGPEPAQRGQHLLGAFHPSCRHAARRTICGCFGPPGGMTRAQSFDDARDGLRCFALVAMKGDSASAVERLAGNRDRHGHWHVGKVRDAPAYVHALARNLEKVGFFFGAAWLVLIALAAMYWRWRGRERALAAPFGARLFPYLRPQARAVLWLALLTSTLVAALPLLVMFFPAFAFFVLLRQALSGLKTRTEETSPSGAASLPDSLGMLATVTLVAAGLLVPLHLAYVISYHALGLPPDGSLADLVATPVARSINRWVAVAGAVVVTAFLAADAFWRLHQARSVATLATSRAASASAGLVELQGIAVAAAGGPVAGGPMLELRESTEKTEASVRPFDLADDSGIMRIDARGAAFSTGWIADLLHVFLGFHEIVLTRRVAADKDADLVTRRLEAGDPVYVIGHASWKRDPETGAEMKVVAPLGRSAWDFSIQRIFLGARRPRDFFFLTDSDEEEARRHLLRGFRRTGAVSIVWLAGCAFLYWSAS